MSLLAKYAHPMPKCSYALYPVKSSGPSQPLGNYIEVIIYSIDPSRERCHLANPPSSSCSLTTQDKNCHWITLSATKCDGWLYRSNNCWKALPVLLHGTTVYCVNLHPTVLAVFVPRVGFHMIHTTLYFVSIPRSVPETRAASLPLRPNRDCMSLPSGDVTFCKICSPSLVNRSTWWR